MKKYIYIFLIFFFLTWLFTNVTKTRAKCEATSGSAIATTIAEGHAWKKHKNEFVAGKVIAGLAMPSTPRVKTSSEFASHIRWIILFGSSKHLSKRRKAYWYAPTGTIVIYDPANKDCGTAFRPVDGNRYYKRL